MANSTAFDFDSALKQLQGNEKNARIAFQSLYDHIWARLYAFGKKYLKTEAMAEDLVQDVFIALWVKRDRLKQVNNLESFIYGMVKRMALAVIRKSINAEIIKAKHIELLEAQNDPMKEKCSSHIDALVEMLPTPRREIFQLSKIHGIKCQEIASRFHISVDSVHQHLSRAKRFIREHKGDVLGLILTIISFNK